MFHIPRLLKITVGSSTTTVILYCGLRIYDFDKEFRNLNTKAFKGRTLIDKLNLTYLYTTHKTEFTRKIVEEHNLWFDRFKNDGIWSLWYNTPRACVGIVDDLCLTTSRCDQGDKVGRKYCIGYECDLIHKCKTLGDLMNRWSELNDIHGYETLNKDSINKFIDGDFVYRYIHHMLGGHFIYEKLASQLKCVDDELQKTTEKEFNSLSSLSQVGRTTVVELSPSQTEEYKRKLFLVKRYIEQVKEMTEMRKNDKNVNILNLRIREEDFPLYYLIRLYYLRCKVSE